MVFFVLPAAMLPQGSIESTMSLKCYFIIILNKERRYQGTKLKMMIISLIESL